MTGPRFNSRKQHRNGWALPGRVVVHTFPLAIHALTILDAEFRKALRKRA